MAGFLIIKVTALGALICMACTHIFPKEAKFGQTGDADIDIARLVILGAGSASIGTFGAEARVLRAIACVTVFGRALRNTRLHIFAFRRMQKLPIRDT